jgi:signal transduction histidine kinase
VMVDSPLPVIQSHEQRLMQAIFHIVDSAIAHILSRITFLVWKLTAQQRRLAFIYQTVARGCPNWNLMQAVRFCARSNGVM